MGRTYSTMLCAVWEDPDFQALTADARDSFFLLMMQPEINAAGAMALTLKRWAKYGPHVEQGIKELAHAGFVEVDEDTEEILLPLFIENDGGYKHAKRVHAVIASVKAIRSQRLRETAANVLARLGVSKGNPLPTDSATVVVTEVSTHPQATTPNPQEGAVASDPSPFCSSHPNGSEKPCGPCGTAKMRYARWTKSQPSRRAAAADARSSCPDCHGSGWLENDDGTPGAKCEHQSMGRRHAIEGAGQ